MLLYGCQKETTEEFPKYEIKETDVYSVHGNTERVEVFERFLEDVKNEKESTVRVVNVTIEGDPLIWDIKYEKGTFHSKFDTTYDKYSSPSVQEFKCKGMVKEEKTDGTEKETEYTFKSCEGYSEGIYIFSIREKKEEEQYIEIKKYIDSENKYEKQKELVDLESVDEIKILLKEIKWEAKKVQMSKKADFEILIKYKDNTIKAIPNMYMFWLSDSEGKIEIIRNDSEEMYGKIIGEEAKRMNNFLKTEGN